MIKKLIAGAALLGLGLTIFGAANEAQARMRNGDTWCASGTMYTYTCSYDRYWGGDVCEVKAVGSCPSNQSGPFWGAN
jgi:hypothetical protein